MPEALTLLSQLSQAIESGNPATIEQSIAAIKALPFETADQVMVKYRLAMHLYLVQSSIVEGMEIFRDIAHADIPCEETRLSQMNLAIGLWKTDQKNRAIFELRKVISAEKSASHVKAMALNFLTIFLRELPGHERELEAVQNENIETLAKLAKDEKDSENLAHFKMLWATALEERGKPADLEKALAVAQEIADSPVPLAKKTTSLAHEALKRLSPHRRK